MTTQNAVDTNSLTLALRDAESKVLARTQARTRRGRALAILRDADYQEAKANLDAAWRCAMGVHED